MLYTVGMEAGLCQCGCGGRTRIAPKNNTRTGAVKGKPYRYLMGHGTRLSGKDYEPEDRGHDTPCWVWRLGRDRNGYGQSRTDDGRTIMAHRKVYQRERGTLSDRVHLDHLCRVPECVNPDHLEPVSAAVNVRRSRATKLTAEQADTIRRSIEPTRILSARYSVSYSTVQSIRRGKTWA